MIGAIKIKDGLFIGDELASQDIEFVIANKVTHIINCAGKQILNHWEPIGVAYLTFFWLDQDNQVVLDSKDEASNAIFDFIEEAVEQTESVLVHSVRGQSRATCTLAAYIMRKYRWSLLKSLEFLNSRRPDLEIRATFIHQLSAYEQRLQQKFKDKTFTSAWEDLSDERPYVTSEELILRNTFINARMGPLADLRVNASKNGNKPVRDNKLKWIDENDKERKGKKDGLRANDFQNDLLKKLNIEKVTSHWVKQKSDIQGTLRDRYFPLSVITGVHNINQFQQNEKQPFITNISQPQIQKLQNYTKDNDQKNNQIEIKEKINQKIDINNTQIGIFSENNNLQLNDTNQEKQVQKKLKNDKKQMNQQQIIASKNEIKNEILNQTIQEDDLQKQTTTSQTKNKKENQVQGEQLKNNNNNLDKNEYKVDEKHNRPTATPDMFYKKGEMLEEIDNEEIDELIEGETKKSKNSIINVEDLKKPLIIKDLQNEEEQLMSGIDVDDDEADSDFDQHRNMMLKSNEKQNSSQNNGQLDVRIRASSGSNNHIQQRNIDSQQMFQQQQSQSIGRSSIQRGGSGGSRVSRSGQRSKQTKEQYQQLVQHTIENQQTNIEKEIETENSIQRIEETDRKKYKKDYQNELFQSDAKQQSHDKRQQNNLNLQKRNNNFILGTIQQEQIDQQNEKLSNSNQKREQSKQSQNSMPDQRLVEMIKQNQQVQTQPQNITNIINNNNINNFIINDPEAVASLIQNAGVKASALTSNPSNITSIPNTNIHLIKENNETQKQKNDNETQHSDFIIMRQANKQDEIINLNQQLSNEQNQNIKFQHGYKNQSLNESSYLKSNINTNKQISSEQINHRKKSIEEEKLNKNNNIINRNDLSFYQSNIQSATDQQMSVEQVNKDGQKAYYQQNQIQQKIYKNKPNILMLNQNNIQYKNNISHQPSFQNRHSSVGEVNNKFLRQGTTTGSQNSNSQLLLQEQFNNQNQNHINQQVQIKSFNIFYIRQLNSVKGQVAFNQRSISLQHQRNASQGIQKGIDSIKNNLQSQDKQFINYTDQGNQIQQHAYQPINNIQQQQKQISNIVQKEMAKRHESPRSRRQISQGNESNNTLSSIQNQQTQQQINQAASIGNRKPKQQFIQDLINEFEPMQQFQKGTVQTGEISRGSMVNVQINPSKKDHHNTIQENNNNLNFDDKKTVIKNNISIQQQIQKQQLQENKIGNYQYRNSQQMKLGFGKQRQGIMQIKTPQNIGNQQKRTIIDFNKDDNFEIGLNDSNISASNNNSILFNKTGPIKVQNKINVNQQSDYIFNKYHATDQQNNEMKNNISFKINKIQTQQNQEKINQRSDQYNQKKQSIQNSQIEFDNQLPLQQYLKPNNNSILDQNGEQKTQNSNQDDMQIQQFQQLQNQQKNQMKIYQMIPKTKIKRQLNIFQTDKGSSIQLIQNQNNIFTQKSNHNLAWIAHRNSSVKNRGGPPQKKNNNKGVQIQQQAIIQSVGTMLGAGQTRINTLISNNQNIRPGTAPKHIQQQQYINSQSQTPTYTQYNSNQNQANSKINQSFERPLSPYGNINNTSINQGHQQNISIDQNLPKQMQRRRHNFKRGSQQSNSIQQQQTQENLNVISPLNQTGDLKIHTQNYFQYNQQKYSINDQKSNIKEIQNQKQLLNQEFNSQYENNNIQVIQNRSQN